MIKILLHSLELKHFSKKKRSVKINKNVEKLGHKVDRKKG